MNGSERMIVIGQSLINNIIDHFKSKRGITTDLDILFDLLLTNDTYTH